MESMDRNQAFAFLGLPEDASHDDIMARVDARRRQLELRLRAATTPEQRRLLERALTELEEIRALALLDPRDPAAGLPGGATIVLKAGKLIGDRYVVKERLGTGERGAVFRALDLTWGKDVALKVLLPDALLVPGIMDRLATMLRRALGFAHPGLASVYSLGRADGVTFVTSELIQGENLRQYHERLHDTATNGIPAAAIVSVVKPMCAALTYASERVPHLNLKPENVFISTHGGVKVTDLGLDEVVTVIPRGRSRAMTEQRRFRAPEQVRQARNLNPGQQVVDSRADQYAVAALVYFLATGEAPVADITDLAVRRPDLPSPMVGAVRRALAAAPEARFDSISAFANALFATPRRWMNWLYGLLVVLAVLLLAGVALWASNPAGFERTMFRFIQWNGLDAERLQALALQQRADDLKGRLQKAERDLRQQQRDLQANTPSSVQAAGGKGASPAEERATRDMVNDLSSLALQQIFNSADLLNAYNLMNLAQEHIKDGRYHDAVNALSVAEATIAARLADWRAAEAWARHRHGLDGKEPASTSPTGVEDSERVRQLWEASTAERRKFAVALEHSLVLVPAGSFMMGDMAGDGARAELPVHRVTLAAFKLGRTPVTRGEYAVCVQAGACRSHNIQQGNPNLPMTGINWFDAQEYVTWLRMRTGEDYRLPSEAEWEYAARAGAATAYPWGPDVGRNHASCTNCGSIWDRKGPAPVASFAPNAFGLYDVVGNVWQWTSDCWYRDHTNAPADGSPRDEFACPQRVLRGGSWDNDAWLARLSYRAGAPATLRQDINGFRIAKSVE